MKIAKEYELLIIGGLFLLAYILEAVTNPINLPLATPYEFLTGGYMATYPFTSAIIFIRSLALFMSPLWLLSFFGKAHYTKGGSLLVLAGLMQLYAIQEIAANTQVVPLEWALSLSLGGIALLLPAGIFLFKGMINALNQKTLEAPDPF
jgi:hypothetical protein